MRYMIFHIWDIRDIFEEVAIFIPVTALKLIGITPWYNNESKAPTIQGFHIHLSDFEKNIFNTNIPSCIFYKEYVVKQ